MIDNRFGALKPEELHFTLHDIEYSKSFQALYQLITIYMQMAVWFKLFFAGHHGPDKINFAVNISPALTFNQTGLLLKSAFQAPNGILIYFHAL